MKTIDINNELYIPLLKSLNVGADEHGNLTMKYPDRTAVATVGSKNLLLPMPEVMRAVPENAIIFHPMSENVARGDSAIQNYLKTLVTFKVTFSIIYIAEQLYTIAADQSLHGKLTGDQLAILTILPDADTKGLAALSRVLASVDMTSVRAYNIFNKRAGKLKEESFNRVAVASFPLLEELLKPEGTLWGHRDVRKRDLKDFKALFDYVVPHWETKDYYSAASDSMEAPSFHALMLAFNKIMDPLVKLCDIYGDLFKETDDEGGTVDMKEYASADLSFITRFDNLSKYRNVLPIMVGNDGEVMQGSVEATDVVKNPKSIAPAFMKKDIGGDINVPETQSQQPVQQQQQVQQVQQQQMNNQQQQQNQQGYVNQNQGSTSLGFGSYNSNAIQQRNFQGGYPNQNNGWNNGQQNMQGWGNNQNQGGFGNPGFQGQQQMNRPAGVAGFNGYGSGQGNGWGSNQGNPYGFQGQQQQQVYHEPIQQPVELENWHSTAQQQQQQQFNNQQQQVNPFTIPSNPNGFQGQQGFQGGGWGNNQQQFGNPQGWNNGQQNFQNNGFPNQNNGWGNNGFQNQQNFHQQNNQQGWGGNGMPQQQQQSQGGMFKTRR